MRRSKLLLVVLVLFASFGAFSLPQTTQAQPGGWLNIHNVAGGTCSGTPPNSVFVSYSLYLFLPAGQFYHNVTNVGDSFSEGPYVTDYTFDGPWDAYTATLAADSTWRKTHTIYLGADATTGVDVTAYIEYSCAGLNDGDTALITVVQPMRPPEPEPVVEEPVPGCDALIAIPSAAVGATITATTPVYWKPGEVSDETFPAGLSLRAIGVDASGMYTKVLYACGFYWVPRGAIGPNSDAVWQGKPLPTGVVE